MPLKNIFTTIQVSQRKKKVIKTILLKEQENLNVTNIHSIDKKNIGDYFCAPHHYFDELKNTQEDIFNFKSECKKTRKGFIDKVSRNAIIVGGGGLLNRGGFKRQMKLMEDLTHKNKKVILWGIGHNEKDPSSFGKVKNYNVDLQKFGLAGTRDFTMPGDYVPCVSCLHPIFDNTYEVIQEVGVVFHKETLFVPEILAKFKDYPSTSNTTDLISLIRFIGSSEKIITDSYHAMYWSMLLGKAVVVVPNSSKFYDFKYKPIFSSFEESLNDLKKSNEYSGVLEECRSINTEFSEKVFNYLDL